jgi:hypothetical protein
MTDDIIKFHDDDADVVDVGDGRATTTLMYHKIKAWVKSIRLGENWRVGPM